MKLLIALGIGFVGVVIACAILVLAGYCLFIWAFMCKIVHAFNGEVTL